MASPRRAPRSAHDDLGSRAGLISAHLERSGFGTLARALAPILDTHGRSAGAHARSLALTSMRKTGIGRRLLIAATALAIGSAACIGLVAVLATQLLPL